MNMKKIYKPAEASEYTGLKVNTLQRLDREGKLKAHRTATNRRYYYEEDLEAYLHRKSNKQGKIVLYARVSSYPQKADLKHQVEYLRNYVNAKGIIPDEVITDVGSGLNYNRKKWNKLLQEVEDNKISQIYVTYKDRFIRFGFEWFNRFCNKHGAEIIVLNNPDLSPQEEIAEDLITIIHVFSSRSYGIRQYKKKIEDDIKEGEKIDRNQ